MHKLASDILLDEVHSRLSNHSHRGLERSLGLKNNALAGMLDKKPRVPSVDKAKEIAEALGFEFYIGPPRDGARSPGFAEEASDYIAQANINDEALGAGYIPAKWHTELPKPSHPFPIAVHKDWVIQNGWALKTLFGVVVGDGVDALGWLPGTPILVNHTKTLPTGKLTAYLIDGAVRVGHYHQLGDSHVQIIECDTGRPPIIVSSPDAKIRTNVIILGTVVWAGVGVDVQP